jgi:hypothetical protein
MTVKRGRQQPEVCQLKSEPARTANNARSRSQSCRVDAPLGEQSKVPLFLGRILALLDAITVAAGQRRCERYDSQYAHALISGNSATLF